MWSRIDLALGTTAFLPWVKSVAHVDRGLSDHLPVRYMVQLYEKASLKLSEQLCVEFDTSRVFFSTSS